LEQKTKERQFMKSKFAAVLAVVSALLCGALPSAHAAKDARLPFEPIELYATAQRSSTFEACKKLFPGGQPIELSSVPAAWKPRGLCSNAFAVVHSGLSKTPLVVVERLNRQTLRDAKGEERTDAFYADPRLPRGDRAELQDYARSGYDRGHLAPAADQPQAQAMAQSFALSNMIPQDPTNNRKVWNKLESDTRKFAERAGGDVFVFSGPLFDAGYETIGKGKVWVPTRLFKLVYDEASGRSWAHVLPNTADARIGPPMSYEQFVQTTGWDFLPRPPKSKGSDL
jgi:endonuclease G